MNCGKFIGSNLVVLLNNFFFFHKTDFSLYKAVKLKVLCTIKYIQ